VNDGNVAIMYRQEHEAELPIASKPVPLGLDDKWKRIEEATNTIGYTQEFEKVNQEKNTVERKSRQLYEHSGLS
jgi:hypothetical protein